MTVWRDRWGIPRVVARSVRELAYEQGLATAEDRAWQLEVERLRGAAATAELLGPAGEVWDRFARAVDLDGLARRAYAGLSAETAGFLDAYVEGVRDGFARGATSPEFDRLGVTVADTPGEWEPWTPLAVFAVQHVLFSSFPTKLWREHVAARAGVEAADLLRAEPVRGGSNAFAVGGSRTASGSPLLAGDPHRLLEAPGVYAQVGLATPDLDVVGLTFPGVPGVQHFGQTTGVAWAITNAMADYVDVEVVDGDGGPVPRLGTAAGDLGDLGFEALLGLLHARSTADVDLALAHWVEPVNDVLVADTAGRVLHRVAGRVPVRGDDGAWRGWQPPPRREVAPDEVAVSANDRTDPSYDVLAEHFEPPLRRDRIAALLDGRRDVTVADAAAVLTDVRQNAGETLLERVARTRTDDPAVAALRDELGVWDRAMDASSTTAAAYAAVREAVVDALVAAPALAGVDGSPHGALLEPWFHLPTRVAAALHHVLEHDRPFGLDAQQVVADALAAVAADRPAGPWGARHRYAPVHAFADFGLDPAGLLPEGAGRPLAGDSECVASTVTIPGAAAVVRGSAVRYVWDTADLAASRWAVPGGASGVAGSPHHGDQFDAWRTGELVPARPYTLEDVDPDLHADTIHGWVVQPWAAFWGMGDHTRDEVAEVYGWIVDQPHLTARLVRCEGVPVGIVQTYDPFVDVIGEHYDRRPGDLGVHLFLAHDPARAGQTGTLVQFLLAQVLADPSVRRLVMEPDVRNHRSVAMMTRLGATLGPVVDLPGPVPGAPGKTAQFAFMERPRPRPAG